MFQFNSFHTLRGFQKMWSQWATRLAPRVKAGEVCIGHDNQEFAPGTHAGSPRSPRLRVSEARRAEFAEVECSASAPEERLRTPRANGEELAAGWKPWCKDGAFTTSSTSTWQAGGCIPSWGHFAWSGWQSWPELRLWVHQGAPKNLQAWQGSSQFAHRWQRPGDSQSQPGPFDFEGIVSNDGGDSQSQPGVVASATLFVNIYVESWRGACRQYWILSARTSFLALCLTNFRCNCSSASQCQTCAHFALPAKKLELHTCLWTTLPTLWIPPGQTFT